MLFGLTLPLSRRKHHFQFIGIELDMLVITSGTGCKYNISQLEDSTCFGLKVAPCPQVFGEATKLILSQLWIKFTDLSWLG
jgi:hypothetical protein